MKNKVKWGWLIEGIVIAAVFSIIFMSLYDMFLTRASSYTENPIETESNISWLYSNNQLLYRDLYNLEHQTQVDYVDLYYSLDEAFRNIDLKAYHSYIYNDYEVEFDADEADLYETYREIEQGLEGIQSYFSSLENQFSDLNNAYDYYILDTETGKFITNSGKQKMSNEDYYFYLKFRYDENGNVTIESVQGEDSDMIRKYASEISRPGNRLPSDRGVTQSGNSQYLEYIDEYTERQPPVNCEITYAMTGETRSNLQTINRYGSSYYSTYRAFSQAGCGSIYIFFASFLFLLGIFLPLYGKAKPWEEHWFCRLPLELSATLVMFLFGIGSTVVSMAVENATDQAAQNMSGLLPMWLARLAVNLANFLFLMLLYSLAWLVGICVREARERGIWGYVKKRWFFYQIFPFLKRKISAFYHELTHIDLTSNAKKMIIKIVLVNGIVLFIISSMWVAGFAMTVVYSILLYFILKKYVSGLQKKYEILLTATNEIAQGNLNVMIHEDLGVFEPFRPEIVRIQKGFKKAVEEEVKSQHMKAELITNVSHDLKTPLTAIITYIGLLKDENISEEQKKEYLDTLERKSLRLKVLIEDLFEISKATSKTVKLDIMDVDIINLVKQAKLEMSEKLEAAKLEVRMLLPEEKVILPLDSQKTFRIYENLFGNIAKYALPGTRVYVNATVTEETVSITLKNISAQEIQVSPEELTDRFVRGDASRNTEGSGLGLAIAKSFTELQNGKLTVEMDGDLFKVTTTWHRRA